MLRNKPLVLAMLLAAMPAFAAAQNPPAPAVAGSRAAHNAADAPATPADSAYVIGPSDELMITVWNQPSLSGASLVRPDGKITIPLVGEIMASGKTPVALGDEVALRLKKIMQNPSVYVVVTGVHSKVVYFIGQIAKQGAVTFTSNMTVLEAIADAGGVTEFARTNKIYILRKVNGQTEKIHVAYKQAVKGSAAADVALEPGDTIVIP